MGNLDEYFASYIGLRLKTSRLRLEAGKTQYSPNEGAICKIRSNIMNWDEIKGDWKQLSGKLKTQWGKLTDDDLTQIGGKKDELVGKLQKHYGHTKEEAEKHLDDFIAKV
jgi:uncharacterized protein YjbJ (UPF0337 family)